MAPFSLNLEKTRTEISVVMVEPALNVFGSMLLAASNEENPGVHEWVTKTRAAMTPEEQFRHKLVIIGLHYAILPQATSQTFESYLAGLETTPPSVFRQRLLDAYSKICISEEARAEAQQPVDWDEVLSSSANYVSFLRHRFGAELTDEEIETRAYEYVIDPAALKQLITGHIRWFWKNHLQAEWTRVRPMLEESARAFNQVDVSHMTRRELIQFVTGKEITESKWGHDLTGAENLIFIPNAHIGPYMRATKIGENFFV